MSTPTSELRKSTLRVLITGSRTWPDEGAVWAALDAVWAATGEGVREFVVVHGCARGADLMARAYCEDQGEFYEVDGCSLVDEGHPADWSRHGKRAGYLRNTEMVRLGADLCLAFIHERSKGATMCANLAEDAGIPTRRFVA